MRAVAALGMPYSSHFSCAKDSWDGSHRPAVQHLSLELRFPLDMSKFLTPKALDGNLLMSGWLAAGKTLKEEQLIAYS